MKWFHRIADGDPIPSGVSICRVKTTNRSAWTVYVCFGDIQVTVSCYQEPIA